ncbi:MAG: DnaD domain protein [Dehalococcoidales bacterium]|nr:DnaD domain protein [Dehalococcoidales bacterium]
MKKFNGFPARLEFTPIPNLFFSAVLPQVTDVAELKATLYVMAALYRKRGYPKFVGYGEMAADAALMSSLQSPGKETETILRSALQMTVERGIFLHLQLEKDGKSEDVYFLNNDSNRQIITRIKNGEFKLSGLKVAGREYVETETPPDIFVMYEQNIGMLTPLIADELKEAEKLYPADWIRDAIKEAVNQNKRKWSYISAILEHWSNEGRSDGTHPRDSQEGGERYLKQRYGHMVQR